MNKKTSVIKIVKVLNDNIYNVKLFCCLILKGIYSSKGFHNQDSQSRFKIVLQSKFEIVPQSRFKIDPQSRFKILPTLHKF